MVKAVLMEPSELTRRHEESVAAALGRNKYVSGDDELVAWQCDAACRGLGPSVFFAEEDVAEFTGKAADASEVASTAEALADDDSELAAAREVCAKCAVRIECLEFAILLREKQGVWGGLTPTERTKIIRARQRAAARRRRLANTNSG